MECNGQAAKGAACHGRLVSGPVRFRSVRCGCARCGSLWRIMACNGIASVVFGAVRKSTERLATLRFGVLLSSWPRFGTVRASSDAGKVCQGWLRLDVVRNVKAGSGVEWCGLVGFGQAVRG